MIESDAARPEPDPHRGRPRPRFGLSLRALMVVVLAVGGGLGWVVHPARVQREAVRAIRAAGGLVRYDWQWRYKRPSRAIWAPRWLVDRLGIDYFSSISMVSVLDARSDVEFDAIAGQIGRLGRVERLHLQGPRCSDSTLKRLAGLQVRNFSLMAARVTDEGLSAVRGMTSLEALNILGAQVGDAGMAHLEGLSRLKRLYLTRTRVGDAGMESVGRLRGLEALGLAGTQVGDPGLARLRSLDRLKILELRNSMATRPAVEALRIALPGAVVNTNPASPIAP